MPRRIALISDIHANLPALEAVLQDIEGQGVEAIYCLGDVVGYGPQPIETLDRVMAVTAPGKAIAGNHDHAVVVEAIGFNRSAREAVDWTREIMQPRWFEFGAKRQRWQWLKNLPTILEEGDIMYVHASPRQHLEEYILEEHTQGMSYLGEDPETMLEENFQLVKRVCFIGHTHRPGALTADYRWFKPADVGMRWNINEGAGDAIPSAGPPPSSEDVEAETELEAEPVLDGTEDSAEDGAEEGKRDADANNVAPSAQDAAAEAQIDEARAITALSDSYEPANKVIINIGSVGQPRDGDPRACYVIFDGEVVEWRRVEYNVQAVRSAIENHQRLDNRLGDRLAQGK